MQACLSSSGCEKGRAGQALSASCSPARLARAALCVHDSVYRTLARAEVVDRPNPHLFQAVQQAVTPQHRALLVDWLVDCVEELGLRSETLFLAVGLLDRHLSVQVESTQWLQLLGAACLWTASKVEEVGVPNSEAMVMLTDNTFTVAQLASMERRLLHSVQHRVVRPSIHTFLATLVHISQAEELYGCVPADGGVLCPMCYWDRCDQAYNAARHASMHAACEHEQCAQQTGEAAVREQQHMRLCSVRTSGSLTSASSSGLSQATVLCMYELDGSCGAAWKPGARQGTMLCTSADDSEGDMLGGQACANSLHRQCMDAAAGAVKQPATSLPPACPTPAQAQLGYLARFVSECCLLDHQLLDFLPSQVAAASLMLARAMLGLPAWTPALAQHTGLYGPLEQAECLLVVADAYAHARYDTQLLALRNRYGSRRMDVATLQPSAEAVQLVAACRAILLEPMQCMQPVAAAALAAHADMRGTASHAALDTWQFDNAMTHSILDVTPVLVAGTPLCGVELVAPPAATNASLLHMAASMEELVSNVSERLVQCTLLDERMVATASAAAPGPAPAAGAPQCLGTRADTSMQLPSKFNPFLDSDSLSASCAANLSSISASHLSMQPSLFAFAEAVCPDIRVISCPGMACTASLPIASSASATCEELCGALPFNQLHCLSEAPGVACSLLLPGSSSLAPGGHQGERHDSKYHRGLPFDTFLDDVNGQR